MQYSTDQYKSACTRFMSQWGPDDDENPEETYIDDEPGFLDEFGDSN